MSDNLVILIHGKAFAGKDSVYNTLRLMTSKYFQSIPYNDYHTFVNNVYTETVPEILQQHVEHCIRVPFADEVKRELCRINPKVDYKRLMSDSSYKSTYRKELVEIGDGYRQDDPDIWVKKHRANFFPMLKKEQKKLFFITDARYLNEYDYAEEIEKETGNIVIRVKVHAPLADRLSRMSYDAAKKYIKFSKYNAGERLEEIAAKNGRTLEWDVVVENNNVKDPLGSRFTFDQMGTNAFWQIRCGNSYQEKYIILYSLLQSQLTSISKVYENLREVRL